MNAPQLVYILCFATCALCSGLLLRSWFRVRTRLLFWSAISFSFLAVSNFFLFADLILFPAVDLTLYRQGAALIAVAAMIYGFIWEAE